MGKKVQCCVEEGGSYRPCNRGDNSKHKYSGLWLTPGLDTSKPFPFTTQPQNAHTPPGTSSSPLLLQILLLSRYIYHCL